MGKNIIKIISTFFYIGLLPLIPGTFGSIAGIGIYLAVGVHSWVYILTTLALMILGFLVSGKAEGVFCKKDSSSIVIDEVSGMLLSLLFLPYNFTVMVIAFFLFRILDTLKPYPAGSLQNLKGSLGIMADDIIAAFYTNIILQAALRLACFKIS